MTDGKYYHETKHYKEGDVIGISLDMEGGALTYMINPTIISGDRFMLRISTPITDADITDITTALREAQNGG